MRWFMRLGAISIIMVLSTVLGVRLVNLFIEWWHRPPVRGMRWLSSASDDSFSNEFSNGKERIGSKKDPSTIIPDNLEYSIDAVPTVIQRGDSMIWSVLMGCLMILAVLLMTKFRFLRHVMSQSEEESTLFKRRRQTTPSPLQFDAEAKLEWTHVMIRDLLIQFNQALPRTDKWQSSETVTEWFKRIGCHSVDLTPYFKTRYTVDCFVTEKEVEAYRQELEAYLEWRDSIEATSES
ncbi:MULTISPECIES: hypothetical protein [Exiguobacterium]|uniref:hypothetical protein n=1 Tax=Exiguobacterium TaxID=33986 RepID=UPI001BEA466B|nr:MULTISPECIES: hypothetical protein [Exiguobacterium]MCT4782270.1 hypothetical protein [Exiguobacterium himgiriensis]